MNNGPEAARRRDRRAPQRARVLIALRPRRRGAFRGATRAAEQRRAAQRAPYRRLRCMLRRELRARETGAVDEAPRALPQRCTLPSALFTPPARRRSASRSLRRGARRRSCDGANGVNGVDGARHADAISGVRDKVNGWIDAAAPVLLPTR